MLPVAVGLVVISIVFTALNPVFLAPNNLVNLLFDCATVGIISLGIVCVLMLGEIDLSVGSMSGLASAIFGTLWVNARLAGRIRHPHRRDRRRADRRALCLSLQPHGHAELRRHARRPARAARPAALHPRPTGSINLPYQSPMVMFGQILMMPAWVAYGSALLPGIATIALGLGNLAPAP
jgi:D-xylose transport system permease protein